MEEINDIIIIKSKTKQTQKFPFVFSQGKLEAFHKS